MQLPRSYSSSFPHFARCESVCESTLTISSVFQFNTGGDEIYASHVIPPHSSPCFLIHNSIGRGFLMYSRSRTFQSTIFIRSSSQITLHIENHRAVRFRTKITSYRKKIFVASNLLPSRQTLPRHTGTPPVSQSDELSILIRFSA